MLLPPRDFGKIGPNEGEPFPDVYLPDQAGTTIDLHQARATGKAIVVASYRSDGRVSARVFTGPPEVT
jgi:hypothetical protein